VHYSEHEYKLRFLQGSASYHISLSFQLEKAKADTIQYVRRQFEFIVQNLQLRSLTEYKPVVCLGDAVAIVDFFIHATSVPSQKYNNAVTTANRRKK